MGIVTLTEGIVESKDADEDERDDGADPGAGNSVVREDVSEDTEFAVGRHVAPNERSKEFGNRTTSEPVLEWVEENLAANVNLAGAWRICRTYEHPHEYFCHRLSSSIAVRLTPS
jgi:hypothetical protein